MKKYYKFYNFLENHKDISILSPNNDKIPPAYIQKKDLDIPLVDKPIWNPNKAGEASRIEYYEKYIDAEDSDTGIEKYVNLILAEDFEYTYRSDGKHKSRTKYICYSYIDENGNDGISSGLDRVKCPTKYYFGICRNKADKRKRSNILYQLQIDIVSYLTVIQPDFSTDRGNAIKTATNTGISLWNHLSKMISDFENVGSPELINTLSDPNNSIYTTHSWLTTDLGVLSPIYTGVTFGAYIVSKLV